MEICGSLPCSQQSTTDIHPESDKSSLYQIFSKIRLNNIFPPMHRSFQQSPSGFPKNILYVRARARARVRVRVTLRLTVSQSVSMSWCRAHFVNVWPDIPLFWRVWVWNLLSCLGGALCDERPGLFFVSNSLIICLYVHLLFTLSVQQIMPYYSLVAHATTAV
jgi:hypothetical protein